MIFTFLVNLAFILQSFKERLKHIIIYVAEIKIKEVKGTNHNQHFK